MAAPKEDPNLKALAILVKANYDLMRAQHKELVSKISNLEEIMKTSGLNGDSGLLKEILLRYKVQQDRHSAYGAVRTDLVSRFRWLAAPRRLFIIFISAAVGALAWQLVSGHPLPHL